MEITKEEITAQAQVWKHMYGFAETIMLRCTLVLGIPDILHKQGPMTLHQLANALPHNTINLDRFHHIIRYLVHQKLLKVITLETTQEQQYTLTSASKLLVRAHKKSLAPYVMLQTHPEEISIWGHVKDCLEGKKTYWEAMYGVSMYEKIETDPESNKLFNDAMMSHSMFMIPALVDGLIKGKLLDEVNTLVDVGGNSGAAAKAISIAFSGVRCMVMDLLHVVESERADPELIFVAGDMFSLIPKADVVLMKSTLHNYEDDDCLKILSNCKEAITSGNGKVILVEIVIGMENLPEFSSARLSMEIEMMLMGGKERTKQEWETLLDKAGFSHREIIPIMAIESIIVATL